MIKPRKLSKGIRVLPLNRKQIFLKKTVLFIHSAGPQGRHQGSNDFIALLKKSLGPGYELKHPKMPHPERPDYEPWKAKVAKEIAKLDDGAILIGHSLGGSVLLKYLSEADHGKTFSGLFLVAAPYWGLKGWEYDAFFLKRGFPRKLTGVGPVFLYHTLDDEIVSQDHIVRYAKSMPKAKVRKVKGYGHAFNKEECPELIRDIGSL